MNNIFDELVEDLQKEAHIDDDVVFNELDKTMSRLIWENYDTTDLEFVIKYIKKIFKQYSQLKNQLDQYEEHLKIFRKDCADKITHINTAISDPNENWDEDNIGYLLTRRCVYKDVLAYLDVIEQDVGLKNNI